MAFKTIPIKHLLPSINNNHNRHYHHNNSYPLLPILCTLIHRQTVFQQLLQQLLSILQMILFLCLICNIYPITYIYIFFKTTQFCQIILVLFWSSFQNPTFNERNTYIKFRYFPSFACFIELLQLFFFVS